MTSEPTLIAGRYLLQRQIGQGGMGAVYLAIDQVLGREVAVKRVGLFPGGESPNLIRAEREAKLAARLNHPHVVAIFDFVADGDEQWLVMEHVVGTDLAALVAERGALPADEAARILAQVAGALTAAHKAGIVHRDVKPSNILITTDGTAKLADFGIARARDSTVTASGSVTGSPAYLAPEVAVGKPATDASDVWSLGATLFVALTGQPPYDTSDSVLSAMYRIVHEAPPRIPDGGWPADLLEHTMATEPDDRWPMQRVREYLAAGPTSAADAPTAPLAAATAPTIAATPPGPSAAPPGAPPGDATELYDDDDGATYAEDDDERRRSWLLPILVGAVVLLLGGILGWVLLNQDPDATANDPGGADSSSTDPSPSESGKPSKSPKPSRTATASETTAAPTTEPTTEATSEAPEPTSTPTVSDTPAPPTGGDAAAMRAFVQQYVDTALADPESAWNLLTPRFQQDCCNGVGGYAGYWNTIASATLSNVQADPAAMEVAYTITWDPEGERGPEDEFVTLGLVEQGGGYLIDYEL